MATITKTYTDADGDALAGTVEFTAYTVAGGRPVAGSVVEATLNGSGAISANLTTGGIYSVVERIIGRSHPQRIVVAVATDDLDDLPVYDDVMSAHLVTSAAAAGSIVGVPAGGTTGQVLAKASNADGDVEWADDATGGA